MTGVRRNGRTLVAYFVASRSLPSHPISLGSFRSFSLRSLPLLSPLDLGCECKVREVTSEPGTSIRRAEVIGARKPDDRATWWRERQTEREWHVAHLAPSPARLVSCVARYVGSSVPRFSTFTSLPSPLRSEALRARREGEGRRKRCGRDGDVARRHDERRRPSRPTPPHHSLLLPFGPCLGGAAPKETTRCRTRWRRIEWCDKNPKGNKESWKSREMS